MAQQGADEQRRPALRGRNKGHVITRARQPKTLDVEQRTKRYLVTMAIRLLCFLAMLWVPGWWKMMCLLGAAVLPVVAVLLANAVDNHAESTDEGGEVNAQPALTAHHVVQGDVVEDYAQQS